MDRAETTPDASAEASPDRPLQASPETPLIAQVNARCRDPAFRRVIAAHLSYQAPNIDGARLNARIHPDDPMLLHSLNHFQEVNWSLSQYFNVALQQHNAAIQVFRLVFGEPQPEHRILDFACGHGRLLRFLSLSAAPAQLWAADIQHDAVDFVAREFGVRGLYSDWVPSRFAPEVAFDFIWVASLFSHLPRRLFDEWLQRLVALLRPGGVLCFSVHDEVLLRDGATLSAEGFHYITLSENADLDESVYGTAWVSEAFVRAAVARALGEGYPVQRIRRGLANEQDIYIVSNARERKLDAVAQFRKGAWGWVDECRVSPEGEVYLHGWAASLDDGAIDGVEVLVDGEIHRCPTGLESEDVRLALTDDRLGCCDWEFRHTLNGALAPLVEVRARSARGEAALLYLGRLAIP